jgi:thiol-disulfide isomerase/thioredoxin
MDTTGLIVVAAVLVLGTAAGFWRRRADGRFHSVAFSAGSALGPSGSVAVGDSAVLGGSVALSGSAGVGPGLVVDGSASSDSAAGGSASGVGPASGGGSASGVGSALGGGSVSGVGSALGGGSVSGVREVSGDPSAAGERIDPVLLGRLGVQPAQATLLQFSSAFCAPCRAVRRISGEVADLLPGVRHVEVDAESHLDAVRALGIWRTPTLLILDADGRVAKRATGVPGKAQLIAALGDLLPAA